MGRIGGSPLSEPVVSVVFSDGAAFTPEKGQTAPCAAGVVSEDGYARAEFLGNGTISEAEYLGVIFALEAAYARGLRYIEVRTDSEFIVKQLDGEYGIKEQRLRPYYERACGLLTRFDRASVKHTGRENNEAAHNAANVALSRGAASHPSTWPSPSAYLPARAEQGSLDGFDS